MGSQANKGIDPSKLSPFSKCHVVRFKCKTVEKFMNKFCKIENNLEDVNIVLDKKLTKIIATNDVSGYVRNYQESNTSKPK